MKTVDIFVYPYMRKNLASTKLYIDNTPNENKDNRLAQFVVNHPMADWLKPCRHRLFVWNGFLHELVSDLNDWEYNLRFHGEKSEYDIFRTEMLHQSQEINQKGRKIEITVTFESGLQISQSLHYLASAFSQLSERAFSRSDFDCVNKIAQIKTRFAEVPCIVLDDNGGITECLSDISGISLKLNRRRPKFVLQVFEHTETAQDIYKQIISVLQEYGHLDCLAVLISENCPANLTQLSQLITKNESEFLSVWKESYLLSACPKDEWRNSIHQYLNRHYYPTLISYGLDTLDELLDGIDEDDSYAIESRYFANKLFAERN